MDAELHLYDLVMIGQKETCGKELFESTMNGKKEYNPVDEARALKIIRYAFEYYLGWTPEQVHANIDPAILKRLKWTAWSASASSSRWNWNRWKASSIWYISFIRIVITMMKTEP